MPWIQTLFHILLRGEYGVAERISDELNRGNRITIPPVAYYEVLRGLLAIDAPRKRAVFENLCASLGVSSIDRGAMDIAAHEYTRLRKAGKPIDDADLLIAAFCIQSDATLVTNNEKHFEGIERLTYTNWIQ